MATLVKFRVREIKDDNGKIIDNDLFVFFPQLNYNKHLYGNKFKDSYSHVGQHSSCCVKYEKESRPATEEEYKGLKEELESIGYVLKVCK
jgi:hypothetical protein